jgi:hypothetical protein
VRFARLISKPLQKPGDLHRVPMTVPDGVGTARASSALAIPFKLVIPLSRNSAMIGARWIALATARAVRALSAMFGAR